MKGSNLFAMVLLTLGIFSSSNLNAQSGSVVAKKVHSEGAVIINGISLSDNQILELMLYYGVSPQPGNYWYDSFSGLYGVVGYPAYGFMLSGHDFGKMRSDASRGQTNVFLNRRELTSAEWESWSLLLGFDLEDGNYWFDRHGNIGRVGNPIAIVNAYVAAQQNSFAYNNNGGDNFWSSRFSAGNYYAGNQQGYVSVPGIGPVSYGF